MEERNADNGMSSARQAFVEHAPDGAFPGDRYSAATASVETGSSRDISGDQPEVRCSMSHPATDSPLVTMGRHVDRPSSSVDTALMASR